MVKYYSERRAKREEDKRKIQTAEREPVTRTQFLHRPVSGHTYIHTELEIRNGVEEITKMQKRPGKITRLTL